MGYVYQQKPLQPPTMSDLYFPPAIAGLFVLIIVVATMTMLMIRKRP